MAKKKVVKKKKRVEPKVAKQKEISVVELELENERLRGEWEQLVQCLRNYTKKDQIGDLANPAIELLIKLGVMDVPKD